MNGRVAKMHRRMGARGRAFEEKRKRRRDSWLAFLWHTAELAIVSALIFVDPSRPIAVLLALSLIGWAWSLGHLPGRTA